MSPLIEAMRSANWSSAVPGIHGAVILAKASPDATAELKAFLAGLQTGQMDKGNSLPPETSRTDRGAKADGHLKIKTGFTAAQPFIPPWADQDPAPLRPRQMRIRLPVSSRPLMVRLNRRHRSAAAAAVTTCGYCTARSVFRLSHSAWPFASSGDRREARTALGHWARTSTGGSRTGAARVARAARTGGAALAGVARAGAVWRRLPVRSTCARWPALASMLR